MRIIKCKLVCILLCLILTSCKMIDKPSNDTNDTQIPLGNISDTDTICTEFDIREALNDLYFSGHDRNSKDYHGDDGHGDCFATFKSIEDIEKCLKYDEEDPEEFENWARSRGIMNAAYNYFSIRGYEVADIAKFLYEVPIPCLEPQIFDEESFSISMSLEEPDWIRIRYYSEKDTNIEYTFQYFFDPVKKIDYEGFAKEVTLEEHIFSLYHMRHIGTQGHIDNSTIVEKEFLIGYFSTDFCDVEVWVEGYEDLAEVSFDDFKLMSIKEITNNK